jgi:hypothetical protein
VARSFAFLFDLEQQCVPITVDVGLAYELAISARITFTPQLLSASTPVDHATFAQRHRQTLGIHPCHHQDVAGHDVLGDGWNETIAVERDLISLGGFERLCHERILSEIQASMTVDSRCSDRMYVSLSQHDVVGTANLDFIAVFGAEENSVANLS